MLQHTPGYIFKSGDVVTPARLNDAIARQTATAAALTLLGAGPAGPEGGPVAVGEIPATAHTLDLLKAETPAASRALLELGNVDNVSDLNKPVSETQQAALDALSETLTAAIATAIAALTTKFTPALIPGQFALFLHPKEALPEGWFFPDGRWVATSTTLGAALVALPAALKTAWGVSLSGNSIRLFDPDKFFTTDAAGAKVGRFPRLAGLGAQAVGVTQQDAIRNIKGGFPVAGGWSQMNGPTFEPGPFAADGTRWFDNSGTSSSDGGAISFDASLVVPTAAENRPFNTGMTPGIYLGVTGVPSYIAQ
jgi:hypothetical protein